MTPLHVFGAVYQICSLPIGTLKMWYTGLKNIDFRQFLGVCTTFISSLYRKEKIWYTAQKTMNFSHFLGLCTTMADRLRLLIARKFFKMWYTGLKNIDFRQFLGVCTTFISSLYRKEKIWYTAQKTMNFSHFLGLCTTMADRLRLLIARKFFKMWYTG